MTKTPRQPTGDAKTGKRIRLLRKEQRMTQQSLATELGVTPGAVSSWENGVTSITQSLLPKLAKALRVPTGRLFEDVSDSTRVQVDPGTLAFAIEQLEEAGGLRYQSLSAGKKAKLIAHILATGNAHDRLQIMALIQLLE